MNRPNLPAAYYRWADRLTKLAGVALVAAGLDAGGGTAVGLALGLAGAVVGLATVFFTPSNTA